MRANSNVFKLGLAVLTGCISTDVTLPTGPISLTGTYIGIQEGVAAGIQFQDDVMQMTLFQEDDSLTGQWETLFSGFGTIGAQIIPSDTILEFSFEMIQTTPCDGLYTGSAEARVGIRGTGETTIGINGAYTGSNCDGQIQADFFVQRN